MWWIGIGALEPNLEGLAIFELTCWEPFVSFRSLSLPPDPVLFSPSMFSFVNDLIDEEFILAID